MSNALKWISTIVATTGYFPNSSDCLNALFSISAFNSQHLRSRIRKEQLMQSGSQVVLVWITGTYY